jgi:hypothetical protein
LCFVGRRIGILIEKRIERVRHLGYPHIVSAELDNRGGIFLRRLEIPFHYY